MAGNVLLPAEAVTELNDHTPTYGKRLSACPRALAQRAASAPLIPGNGPVAVLCEGQWRPARVANLDDITGHREVVEPSGVVAVKVQATVAGVRIALRPHGGVELVKINPVGADAGRVVDGLAVSEPGVLRQPERG